MIHKGKANCWIKFLVFMNQMGNFAILLKQLENKRDVDQWLGANVRLISRFIVPILSYRMYSHIDNDARNSKK